MIFSLNDFVKHICKYYTESFSTKPLLHEVFTAVVLMIILNLMQMDKLLEDSPPLSIKKLFGDANIVSNFWKRIW